LLVEGVAAERSAYDFRRLFGVAANRDAAETRAGSPAHLTTDEVDTENLSHHDLEAIYAPWVAAAWFIPCFEPAWYCCGSSKKATDRTRFTGVCAFS
jgi:hypothetical protein